MAKFYGFKRKKGDKQKTRSIRIWVKDYNEISSSWKMSFVKIMLFSFFFFDKQIG